MTDQERAVMQHALEAMEYNRLDVGKFNRINAACQSVRAALAQQAEPVEPVAWLRVIDEAMVTHHLGVADLADDYETAKRKLNNLLCMAQDIGAYFAAPSQRKPLPRHDQHSVDVPGYGLVSVKLARAIEAAHGIIESEIQGDKA